LCYLDCPAAFNFVFDPVVGSPAKNIPALRDPVAGYPAEDTYAAVEAMYEAMKFS
jgi:hypothetical protein